MNCPQCNNINAEAISIKVDINTGMLEHILGVECPICGQLSVCHLCGQWEFQGHASFCPKETGLDESMI